MVSAGKGVESRRAVARTAVQQLDSFELMKKLLGKKTSRYVSHGIPVGMPVKSRFGVLWPRQVLLLSGSTLAQGGHSCRSCLLSGQVVPVRETASLVRQVMSLIQAEASDKRPGSLPFARERLRARQQRHVKIVPQIALVACRTRKKVCAALPLQTCAMRSFCIALLCAR